MAKPSAFARLKAVAAPPPPAFDPVQGAGKGPSSKQANRVGKKTVIFYEVPEAVRELKRLAVDQDRTIQDLMQEALDDLLVKHGKHPFGTRGGQPACDSEQGEGGTRLHTFAAIHRLRAYPEESGAARCGVWFREP